jgi:branched-chain amino acid transport system ATP-binding protein
MSLLEVNQLDVFYGEAQALYQVSLKVEQAELVGIVGPNGAGKTTLLRTVSKLIKPTSGMINFDGHSLNQMESHEVARLGLTHIPEGRRLFPAMTVLDNLLLGGITRNKNHRQDTLEKVYTLFPRLKERTGQMAGTLSGGEQQMVAIARALMGDPRLLMLDEPSLGLAPKVVDEIFETIQNINASGVTILLVEQNVQECLSLATRAYVFENGRVEIEGIGSELLDSERIQHSYLGI